MKVTVDIPDGALDDVIRFTNAFKTRRAAVDIAAIVDYNRRRRMAELVRFAGNLRRPDRAALGMRLPGGAPPHPRAVLNRASIRVHARSACASL